MRRNCTMLAFVTKSIINIGNRRLVQISITQYIDSPHLPDPGRQSVPALVLEAEQHHGALPVDQRPQAGVGRQSCTHTVV